MKSRTIILPDVHGDLQKAKTILQHCNVIDENSLWIAQDTMVVQMGDQIDGANRNGYTSTHVHMQDTMQDLKTLNFFFDLAIQAKQNNSLCLSLLGNHEVMNAAGMFSYANLGGCKSCSAERFRLFQPGSHLMKRMAMERPCVIKTGSLLLSHAGVTLRHLSRVSNDLSRYNLASQSFLLGNGNASDYIDLFIGADGFLSHRDYAFGAVTPTSIKDADKILKVTKCSHIITGHNTMPDQVVTYGDNQQVIVFDPGMSRSVADSFPSALEFKNGIIHFRKESFVGPPGIDKR